MKERLRIFDAHTHIGPDNYQLKLGREEFNISIEQLTTMLEKNGIDGGIVMCSSSTYTVCPNLNCLSPSGPMRLIQKEPFTLKCEDCDAVVETKPYFEDNLCLFKSCEGQRSLFPFLTIDLRYPHLEDYVEFFTSRFRVYGIKINCFAIRTSPLSLMEHQELVNLFQRRNLPLLIHSTDGDFPPDDALELSNRCGLRVAIAHGPKLDDSLLGKVSASEKAFIDLSPYLALCKRYGWKPEERLRQILSLVNPRKILFGSDIPFTTDYEKEIGFWRNVRLVESTRQQILDLNALDFLRTES